MFFLLLLELYTAIYVMLLHLNLRVKNVINV